MVACLEDPDGATFEIYFLSGICANSKKLAAQYHVNHSKLSEWVFSDPIPELIRDWKRGAVDQRSAHQDLRSFVGVTQTEQRNALNSVTKVAAQKHGSETEAFHDELESMAAGMQRAECGLAYTCFLLAKKTAIPGNHRLDQEEERLRLYRTAAALILDVLRDLQSEESYWEGKLSGKPVKKRNKVKNATSKTTEGLDIPESTAHQKRKPQHQCDHPGSTSKRQKPASTEAKDAIAGASSSATKPPEVPSSPISPQGSSLFVSASPARSRASPKCLDGQGSTRPRSTNCGPFILEDYDDDCPSDVELESLFNDSARRLARNSNEEPESDAIKATGIFAPSADTTHTLQRDVSATKTAEVNSSAGKLPIEKPSSAQTAHTPATSVASATHPSKPLNLGRSMLTSKKTTSKPAQAPEQMAQELSSFKAKNFNQSKEIQRLQRESDQHKKKFNECQEELSGCKKTITEHQGKVDERDEKMAQRDEKIAELEAALAKQKNVSLPEAETATRKSDD